MKRWLTSLLGDVRGTSAVEYGLIISLVVLAMIAGLTTFAETSIDMWNEVSNEVTEAGN